MLAGVKAIREQFAVLVDNLVVIHDIGILEPNERIIDPRYNSGPIPLVDSLLYLGLQVAWHSSLPIIFAEMRAQDIVHDSTKLHLDFVDGKARLIARYSSARVIDVSLAG